MSKTVSGRNLRSVKVIDTALHITRTGRVLQIGYDVEDIRAGDIIVHLTPDIKQDDQMVVTRFAKALLNASNIAIFEREWARIKGYAAYFGVDIRTLFKNAETRRYVGKTSEKHTTIIWSLDDHTLSLLDVDDNLIRKVFEPHLDGYSDCLLIAEWCSIANQGY